MSEHYTSNTISVTKWCEKCQAHTEHPVSNHRLGRCANEHNPKRRAEEARSAAQTELFMHPFLSDGCSPSMMASDKNTIHPPKSGGPARRGGQPTYDPEIASISALDGAGNRGEK